MFWKVYQMTTLLYTKCLRLLEGLDVQRELKKSEFFSQETYHFQNFRQETLKCPLLKKLYVSLLTLKGRAFCRLVLRGGSSLHSPLSNFCLNGPNDLTFGMKIVINPYRGYRGERLPLKTVCQGFSSHHPTLTVSCCY